MLSTPFLAQRLKASTDFVEGSAGALLALSVTADPASIFPPPGTIVSGAAAVNACNEKGAAAFAPGAENDFEILHRDADERLAYWTGVQRSLVRMRGKEEPHLRVTEIFRKEAGHWKLLHRHADQLKE
ncbi:MAG: DUF4440 domain-containing protein [Chitinophagaceae bacterium]|nr:MAG: DUF4440 domain-containing protein [Chitinophagaceae bacterium]